MKPSRINSVEDYDLSYVRSRVRQPALRLSHLHLVTPHELENLRQELLRGNVPPDLEAKLRKLARGELGHRYIQLNCRTIIALLQAAQDGSFKAVSRAECERLLRVLAYVRKDDDAIADYLRDGFVDDQKEVRAVAAELNRLLQTFKAWRLRNQVPGMWIANHPLAPVTCAADAL